jgi:Rho-binding antiterminator
MKCHPVACSFYDVLQEAVTRRLYSKIQYYTEIHEFLTVSAVIKNMYTKDGEEFVQLNTGETIRLDRIVRINDTLAPGQNVDDFTCDC